MTRGWWHLVIDRMQGNDWAPHDHYMEEEFADILRYPARYAAVGLVWRDEKTGQIVDLTRLHC